MSNVGCYTILVWHGYPRHVNGFYHILLLTPWNRRPHLVTMKSTPEDHSLSLSGGGRYIECRLRRRRLCWRNQWGWNPSRLFLCHASSKNHLGRQVLGRPSAPDLFAAMAFVHPQQPHAASSARSIRDLRWTERTEHEWIAEQRLIFRRLSTRTGCKTTLGATIHPRQYRERDQKDADRHQYRYGAPHLCLHLGPRNPP